MALDGAAAVGALILLGCVWVGYELFLSPLSAYPGPFAARFTDLWRVYLTYLGNVDENHRRWHRRWGSAVRIGPRTLSVNDPDLIKVIYASTDKQAWLKSDMYKPNDVIVEGMRIPNIFNTSDKAFHAKYSKPIGGFWTLSKILDLEPLIDETLTTLTDKLKDNFVDAPNAGKVALMDEWLTYFAWDSVGNITFGKHYGFIDQGKDVDGMITESTDGLHYFAAISQIPWLDNWLDKNPIYRIGPKPLVFGFLYTVQALTQYQQSLASGALPERKGPETFMEKYNGLKDVYPDIADNNQLINWLMINVLAGGDSTSGAMRSVIYHLGRNPRKYKKLVDELRAARLPMPAQWQDVVKLTYLDAAISEASRVTPAVGLVMERDVPKEGFRLPDGRFVPAGTKIGFNPCVVTRDTGIFGDNVEEYDPDRWLQREGEPDEAYQARRRRMNEVTDLMFGAGNRVCMGKNFVKLAIYKLFATLYSTFDIQLEDVNREWKYHNAWFMYQTDIRMTLRHRDWESE